MNDVAVVTGAGSGIGRACCVLLAARGLRVVGVGRRSEPLALLVEELLSRRYDAVAVPADVATDSGVARICEAIGGSKIRAVVHAAAIDHVAPLSDVTREAFEQVMAINVGGPLFLTQAVAPALATGASITLIGSLAVFVGRDRQALYAASKSALAGLTRSLAADLAPNVRVNCICPGATATPMLDQFLSAYIKAAPDEAGATLAADGRRVLLDRIAEPEEIAATIIHVALDASAMTGAVVPVDLGFTAR